MLVPENAGWSGKGATTKSEAEEELLLRQIRISAFVKPYHYGREQTTAKIQECTQNWKGPSAYDFEWSFVGKSYTGVIDEPMPQSLESGNEVAVTLYRIGHTDDSNRDPLFTMIKEKALKFLTTGPGPGN